MTGEHPEPVRLTDILTNAAAIADYTGASEVLPEHLLQAIDYLRRGVDWDRDEATQGMSPLGRRGPRAEVPETVRILAQGWFARLGGDPLAELSETQLSELETEIRSLAPGNNGGRDG